MFFTLLSLSGEYPLADQYSSWGRVIAALTAVLSVGIFAIPTGLIGAALEGAVSALNEGDEKDYDVDEEDVAEIAAEAARLLAGNEAAAEVVPSYLASNTYKYVTGYLIAISCIGSILGTVESVKSFLADTVTGFVIFYALHVFLSLFFLLEWLVRTLSAGILPSLKSLFQFSFSMQLVDLMSWFPEFFWLAYVLISESKKPKIHVSGDHFKHSVEPYEPRDVYTVVSPSGMEYFPACVTLTASLFRMMKFERYNHGFKILDRVLLKSQGVLLIGGAAAAVLTVFAATLMYYAERHNPDPKTQTNYSSIPMSLWMTTLNMSGEAPLCDYTTAGSLIVGFLSISACAIFAIPVGALGAGFEAVVSELQAEQEQTGSGGEDDPLLPVSIAAGSANTNAEGLELANITTNKKYGAIPVQESFDKEPESEVKTRTELTALERLVEGKGNRGELFQSISLFATLFAVTLEIISTVDYSTLLPKDGEEGPLTRFMPGVDTIADLIAMSEMGVVLWFSLEYFIRIGANGTDYMFSWLGCVDALATFPYYLARGIAGPEISETMDVYDGPLRALRILRLVRLDAYVPSLTLIDDAVRECWAGLSVALFAGLVIWFLFNETLYFAEKDDVDNGEDKRFRNALSSLQYTAVLLSGDYPITDFSLTGKFLCACSVVVAVGVVAVPASILAGAFVELLQQQAEERRTKRYEAAVKMQTIFLRKKAQDSSVAKSDVSSRFGTVVKDAIRYSVYLRGLNAPPALQPFGARLCLWKNHRTEEQENAVCGVTGVQYKSFMMHLIGLNIAAVLLESIPEVEAAFPHWLWQGFEGVSVMFFTLEYLINVISARYDPRWQFSRWNFMTSFVGTADYMSISPFFMQTLILPWVFGNTFTIDATIFRMLRLARIIELEQFFEAFTLLNDVFTKAAPVLKATGVLALILWVGGATAFFYLEPHTEDSAEEFAQGGETPAVYTSIVDALYYMSIFMAGEWCNIDFSVYGSVLCTIYAIIGIALFSIPVGVLFEGFQDVLEEKHAYKGKDNDNNAK